MKKYIGTKELTAKPATRGEYNAHRGWDKPSSGNEADDGYMVTYKDGYVSWSPKAQFEEVYRENGKMDFGHALHFLKAGYRVRRSGWNGKGMYLWLLPAAMVSAGECSDPHLKAIAVDEGLVRCLGSIRMLTADKKVLTGWLASQTDMLSEDWEVLD